jgi:DNA helicase-2/ATP-dependent DNA helicase PcrA
VEAPAGCGKTFQGSGYAADAAAIVGNGRVLVLTHTHAACDVFASRTADAGRVEIRTVDSLIASIAAAYHPTLELPDDPAAWARKKGNEGYRELAFKSSALLERPPRKINHVGGDSVSNCSCKGRVSYTVSAFN